MNELGEHMWTDVGMKIWFLSCCRWEYLQDVIEHVEKFMLLLCVGLVQV